MPLLHLLSYGAALGAFVFMVLSLASGLLWISEVIEEHSRSSKVIGQRGIYVVIALHVLLYFFDSLPLPQTLFSIFCHFVYLQNFSASWPFISLMSPSFLASCALVVIDHFLWFFYFSRITQEARQRSHRAYRGYPGSAPPVRVPGFADIATFFGICVWLAPLFLFLSLSANDNALPTVTGEPSTPTSPSKPILVQPRSSLFKSLLRILPIDSMPRIRPRTRRRETEGIIAPSSPGVPPSPGLGHTYSNIPSPMLSPRHSAEVWVGVGADGVRPPPSFTLSPPPRRSTAPPGADGLGLRRTASTTHDTAVKDR
ncbi:DUF396-domain-containing protein [Gloeophyllum trabeum ATCC 11539]|uniref:DUF396-domain-containing protein n=1 Tax=Gloeophyllum trabeum (strain ATCC 11539 / FP-39264 / Madison 617) TaxID=670483 RepID=S7RW57_GLOTA|nr:DUF396-domain-containing protein [Gloeophyllum trabeum ATCC 11539]EPQ59095.1 DUF396-domain-containing protein [Gloeophyllum trabeum ATCC 11539]